MTCILDKYLLFVKGNVYKKIEKATCEHHFSGQKDVNNESFYSKGKQLQQRVSTYFPVIDPSYSSHNKPQFIEFLLKTSMSATVPITGDIVVEKYTSEILVQMRTYTQ